MPIPAKALRGDRRNLAPAHTGIFQTFIFSHLCHRKVVCEERASSSSDHNIPRHGMKCYPHFMLSSEVAP